MHRFAGFWICGRARDGSLAVIMVVSLNLAGSIPGPAFLSGPAYTGRVQSIAENRRLLVSGSGGSEKSMGRMRLKRRKLVPAWHWRITQKSLDRRSIAEGK